MKRRFWIPVFKCAVTAGVIVYLVRRLGWSHIVETLLGANLCWVGGAVVLFALSSLLGAWQWHLLLVPRGIVLPAWRVVHLYFMGMFFNNMILGTAAADAVRVAALKLGKESARAGFGATFLDRFAGFLALLVLAMGGSLVLLGSGVANNRAIDTAVVALAGTLCCFIAVAAVLVSRRLQKLLTAFLWRLPLRHRRLFVEVLEQVIVDRSNPRLLAGIAVLALVVQLLRIGVHLLCALALGMLTLHNFHYFFIFVPILALFMVVPMPFGVREGLEGTLLTLAGFAPGAVVIGFLATLASIVASLPGGIFFLTIRYRRATSRMGKR